MPARLPSGPVGAEPLTPAEEAVGERGTETGVVNPLRGTLDVVADADDLGDKSIRVEDRIAQSRIFVSRLADTSTVDHEPMAFPHGQDTQAVGGNARHMRMPDETDIAFEVVELLLHTHEGIQPQP